MKDIKKYYATFFKSALSIFRERISEWIDLKGIIDWAKLLVVIGVSFVVSRIVSDYSAFVLELIFFVVTVVLMAIVAFIGISLFALIYAPVKIDLESHQLIVELEGENEKLEKSIRPQLEILFSENASTFCEIMPIRDNNNNQYIGSQVWNRVGVHNTSLTHSINDVRVELSKIEPDPIGHLPLPLHIMHGEERSNLSPGQTRYVDVISIYRDSVPPFSGQFEIHHTVGGLNLIQETSCELTLTVYGENTPPKSKVFRVEIFDGSYRFRAA